MRTAERRYQSLMAEKRRDAPSPPPRISPRQCAAPPNRASSPAPAEPASAASGDATDEPGPSWTDLQQLQELKAALAEARQERDAALARAHEAAEATAKVRERAKANLEKLLDSQERERELCAARDAAVARAAGLEQQVSAAHGCPDAIARIGDDVEQLEQIQTLLIKGLARINQRVDELRDATSEKAASV